MTIAKHATVHRMVTDAHVCPYGVKALDLLRREGYTVDDRWLKTRAQTDAFKTEHDLETTPLVFVDRERVGGYDDLCKHLGTTVGVQVDGDPG